MTSKDSGTPSSQASTYLPIVFSSSITKRRTALSVYLVRRPCCRNKDKRMLPLKNFRRFLRFFIFTGMHLEQQDKPKRRRSRFDSAHRFLVLNFRRKRTRMVRRKASGGDRRDDAEMDVADSLPIAAGYPRQVSTECRDEWFTFYVTAGAKAGKRERSGRQCGQHCRPLHCHVPASADLRGNNSASSSACSSSTARIPSNRLRVVGSRSPRYRTISR